MESPRALSGYEVFHPFEELDAHQKRHLFSEMAKILKRIQDFELPPSIKSFGDVTFDEPGEIVSAATFLGDLAPWQTYEEYFQNQLEVALKSPDANEYIKQWHADSFRQQIEEFSSERGCCVSFQIPGLSSRAGHCSRHFEYVLLRFFLNPKC